MGDLKPSLYRSFLFFAPIMTVVLIFRRFSSRYKNATGETPYPPATRTACLRPSLTVKPLPRGPRTLIISPFFFFERISVPLPAALKRISTHPFPAENIPIGRRIRGMPEAFTLRLMNWPGFAVRAITGAASFILKYPPSVSFIERITASETFMLNFCFFTEFRHLNL